jgi:predicted homoserine dehydrogenase-like protein
MGARIAPEFSTPHKRGARLHCAGSDRNPAPHVNLKPLFDPHAGKPVRVGLIGAGQFGASMIAQEGAIPGLRVVAVCDVQPERGVEAFASAGVPREAVRVCESRAAAAAAIEAGHRAVVADGGLLAELLLDIVVEATGDPEVGAANAVAAIDAGKHLVMVTKEADSVIGPALARRATAAGRIVTPVDGDQPSLAIGLKSWAELLGLSVVAAGKASEYDFVWDPRAATVTSTHGSVAVPGFDSFWELGVGDPEHVIEARGRLLAALPQRTVPDYTELCVIANHTGLLPDRPDLHAAVARSVEVPDIYSPRADGGVLTRAGALDVFNCLRRPDELSFAGGVFVVVECTHRPTWQVLREKGIPVSRSGRHALLWNPQHLLGLEAPLSILAACRLGATSGASDPHPVCDVVARARRALRAGERLALQGNRHAIEGLDPLLVDAAPVRPGNPLPYYMLPGLRLKIDVPAGATLRAEHVTAPTGSVLWRLRAEQDAAFFPG